jgi:hypothetical protein
MFFKGSRYEKTGTYIVTTREGRQVTVAKLPLPGAPRLLGFHRRKEGERLDHMAARYLSDPTGFWKMCDANNSPVPDALSARPLIGVPFKE